VSALSPDVLGISEVERFLCRAAKRFPPSELISETQWLRNFGTCVRERLSKEREGSEVKAENRKAKDPPREWWRLISDPHQIEAEWRMVGERSRD
jgi:hypothetical protein